MKLLLMADLHGTLPVVTTEADVAVIAGDVIPATSTYSSTKDGLLRQVQWIHERFIPWLQTLPVTSVVITWGNHDWFADQKDGSLVPELWWPENVHVLVNKAVTLDGVKFYGVPQQPRFYDWAFNEDDTPEGLGQRWQQVPDDTDVLVTHGPPFGCVDWVGSRRCGSKTMATWLKSGTDNLPTLVVCGHIHAAGGNTRKCGETVVMNVALADEQYRQVRQPVVADWDKL